MRKNYSLVSWFAAGCFALMNHQFCQAQEHQITAQIVQTFEGDLPLTGFKGEYGYSLGKRFVLTGSIGFHRYNDFPSFTNGGMSSSPNPALKQYLLANVRNVGPLWSKVNEQVYLVGAEYNFIRSPKHDFALKLETGLTIQDALEYGLDSTSILIYQDGSTELKDYTEYFAHRAAHTAVILPGLSYQYHFSPKWVLKTTISGQLPLIRDQYFFSRGGAGFDEYLKASVGVGYRL